MKVYFAYLVTDGPGSPGEEQYIDLSQSELPAQEYAATGDTVFRQPIGIVVAMDADEAFGEAEEPTQEEGQPLVPTSSEKDKKGGKDETIAQRSDGLQCYSPPDLLLGAGLGGGSDC